MFGWITRLVNFIRTGSTKPMDDLEPRPSLLLTFHFANRDMMMVRMEYPNNQELDVDVIHYGCSIELAVNRVGLNGSHSIRVDRPEGPLYICPDSLHAWEIEPMYGKSWLYDQPNEEVDRVFPISESQKAPYYILKKDNFVDQDQELSNLYCDCFKEYFEKLVPESSPQTIDAQNETERPDMVTIHLDIEPATTADIEKVKVEVEKIGGVIKGENKTSGYLEVLAQRHQAEEICSIPEVAAYHIVEEADDQD